MLAAVEEISSAAKESPDGVCQPARKQGTVVWRWRELGWLGGQWEDTNDACL